MNFTEYNKLQGLISLRSRNNSNAKRGRVSSWSKQMNFKTKRPALLDGREVPGQPPPTHQMSDLAS